MGTELESEYPTEEQIKEMFTAWKKDGKEGIRAVLLKRRREREEAEAENARGDSMLSQEDALRAYAKMMNTLDSSKFAPLLADDFHYASQKVFAEIESKQEYLDYITRKLEAVKASDAKVWAEMGVLEESPAVLSHGWGTPCVVMAQGERDNIVAQVFAEVKDGRVQRLDMCMPQLYRWKRSSLR